jgi:hypothetical protein
MLYVHYCFVATKTLTVLMYFLLIRIITMQKIIDNILCHAIYFMELEFPDNK